MSGISPSSSTSTSSSPATTPTTPSSPLPRSSGQQWIQSKRKNLSLMNPSTYKKTMAAKAKSIRTSQEAKLKMRQERAKLASKRGVAVVTMDGSTYNKSRNGRTLVMRDPNQDKVVINGIAFEMDPRGNKLVRKAATMNNGNSATSSPFSSSVASSSTAESSSAAAAQIAPGATPKQISMNGVVFVRTNNGNLIRATLVKQKLAAQAAQRARPQRLATMRKPVYCRFFTRFGKCPNVRCTFIHSRDHRTICKKFLRGICSATANTCILSHKTCANNTPPCVYFQRVACNKEGCLYPHIRINPQAPICRPFATGGWCEAGIECKDRHVWICPDFGTPEGCKKRCGLAHVANGGIKPKRNAGEMEEERRDRHGAGSASGTGTGTGPGAGSTENANGYKRRRIDNTGANSSPSSLGQQDRSRGVDQYDENFIPLDLGDDFEAEENELLHEQEGQEAVAVEEGEDDEEEDAEDISSDELDASPDDAEDVDSDNMQEVSNPEDEDDEDDEGEDQVQEEIDDYEEYYRNDYDDDDRY
ncbi:hypothetical protein BG011_007346 [Mortierella polycephala]|uniref:C3H1-type domain-containing protein n=1 Tax=Mortierella polycephala TaxID=41804 RepID=A0A9P6TYB3_9FUNG|nr:hypothetical protein BG011_007346 [Mortierella polycephala]